MRSAPTMAAAGPVTQRIIAVPTPSDRLSLRTRTASTRSRVCTASRHAGNAGQLHGVQDAATIVHDNDDFVGWIFEGRRQRRTVGGGIGNNCLVASASTNWIIRE